MNRPALLTVAGNDPSGGAGLAADGRMFARAGFRCLPVCTAATVQNNLQFLDPGWVSQNAVLSQLSLVLDEERVGFAKIGLVRDAEMLSGVLGLLRLRSPGTFVLWDPILSASAGFSFHDAEACQKFAQVLPFLDLVTPNLPEARALAAGAGMTDAGSAAGDDLAAFLASRGPAVLLKGGHAVGADSCDLLYPGPSHSWAPGDFVRPRLLGVSRHGSGCTLSAGILASLASGRTIVQAVQDAGDYVHRWLVHGDERPWRRRVSRLQVLTLDGAGGRSHEEQAQALLRAGCDWIQVRCKGDGAEAILRTEGVQIQRSCRSVGATCVFNDRADLAHELAADGAHLGLGDGSIADVRAARGPWFLLGATANTEAHVENHLAAGADYVGLGPFRPTTSKQNLSPVLGLAGVKRICAAFPRARLVVIGGLQPDDVPAILDAGAHGVAVSSGIVAAPDIGAAYRQYQSKLTAYPGVEL